MPTIALPRRPEVELFHPFTTKAVVDSNRYIDEGTHLDTGIKIWHVDSDDLVVHHTAGHGAQRQVIGCNLLAGEAYRCRVRYQNETGWGKWSLNAVEYVSRSDTFTALSVPGEPASAGEVPILPDYALDMTRSRGFSEWVTDTDHIIRRLKERSGRGACRMVWQSLTTAQKDTLVAFIEAAVEAGESFRVSDPNAAAENGGNMSVGLGVREWMPRGGRLQSAMISAGFWRVQLDAIEVFTPGSGGDSGSPGGGGVFTVGVSEIGGEDAIS